MEGFFIHNCWVIPLAPLMGFLLNGFAVFLGIKLPKKLAACMKSSSANIPRDSSSRTRWLQLGNMLYSFKAPPSFSGLPMPRFKRT